MDGSGDNARVLAASSALRASQSRLVKKKSNAVLSAKRKTVNSVMHLNDVQLKRRLGDGDERVSALQAASELVPSNY